jgi:hypothetical protein
VIYDFDGPADNADNGEDKIFIAGSGASAKSVGKTI